MLDSYDECEPACPYAMCDVTYITHESLSRQEHGRRAQNAQEERTQLLRLQYCGYSMLMFCATPVRADSYAPSSTAATSRMSSSDGSSSVAAIASANAVNNPANQAG